MSLNYSINEAKRDRHMTLFFTPFSDDRIRLNTLAQLST